jgi:NTE family protein
MRALLEAGIWPDVLTGTSAGAVNAAFLSLFPQRLDRLEAIWLALRKRDVFPGGRARVLFNLTRHGFIHAASEWEAFLRREVGGARFEDAKVPCAVVAVRLFDGQRVVFDSGEIVPAIMATTAIPGVFPPYEIDGVPYVDGGVLEHLPLPTILDRGATTIYALDCSWYDPECLSCVSVVDRCSRIGAARSATDMTASARASGKTVHLLRPPLPEIGDGRDFRYTSDLIRAGYEHGQRYLEGASARAAGKATGAEPRAG